MNIVMLMAGGVGRRFGSMIPKQYNLLCGQPVIDYVIDAIRKSKLTDKVVVVIDQQWIEYSDKLKKYGLTLRPTAIPVLNLFRAAWNLSIAAMPVTGF